jgi:NADH-quinone oxidoreductase subunit I
MKITWRHLFVDKVTLHYPEEKWTLPPKSRMRLFMKYEDCIGCGQCARACPVDCIYIKTEKRPTTKPAIWAADGTPIKLDVHVFDIDMSLCCYCNLCTYPCPTNCIYMTPEYEFAATDLTSHLYHFAKPNAKFLTVNPKPPAPKPAAAAGAPAAAPGAPAAATRPAAAATPGTAPVAKPAIPASAAPTPVDKPAPAAAAPAVEEVKPGVVTAPPGVPVAPGAPTPVAPSPGTAPKEAPPTPGDAANPAPNVATGAPPKAGGDTKGSGEAAPPEAVDPEASKA